MATHSSILAWKIPWTEEPSRLQSVGSQRVGHYWATSLHFTSGHNGEGGWLSDLKVCHLALVCVYAQLLDVVHQVPLSGRFSKQDYRSGLSCPPPGDLLHPGSNQHLCCPLLCRWILHCWNTGSAMNTNVDFYQSSYALVDCNLLWVIPLMF